MEQLKNDKNSLQKKLDAAEEKGRESEAALAKAKESDREREDYYKKLEEENKHLLALAYTDELTGANTSAALNKKLHEVDYRNSVFVQVDILGMKSINSEYGKASGDNLLKVTVKALKECFHDNNIYRVMGDNFIVILDETNDGPVKDTLASLKKALEKDAVFIAYGTAIGARCESLAEAMKACEKSLLYMKNEKGGSNGGGSIIENDRTAAAVGVEEIPVDDDDDDDGYDDDLDSAIAENL